MKITILCWKRTTLPEYCTLAEKLCKKLSENGHTIITGAGTGIMESSNKGAFNINKNNSVGITLKILDKEHSKNNYILKENLKFVDTFHLRKKMLMHDTDINIFFPGGMGTLDEFTDLLNLYKTNFIKEKKPIYLVGEKYWNSLIEWFGKNKIRFPIHLITLISDDIDLINNNIHKNNKI